MLFRSDLLPSAGDEMFDRLGRAAAVVDEDRRKFFRVRGIVDEDDRNPHAGDVIDVAPVHPPGNDDAVDVPLKEKAGDRTLGGILLSDGRQEDIIIEIARGEFGAEEDPRIERFGLEKVIVGEEEADVAAQAGCEAAGAAVGVVAEEADDLFDFPACRLADVRLVVEDKRNGRDGKSRFPGYIFNSGLLFHTQRLSKRFNSASRRKPLFFLLFDRFSVTTPTVRARFFEALRV